MKTLFCLLCFAVTFSSVVFGQGNELPEPRAEGSAFVPSRDAQTSQERGYGRYATPQELVHRNAALRAAQRRERMAINARFGYSPSRPPAGTLPFMGSPIPPTANRYHAVYPGLIFPRYYSRF